LHSKYTVYTDKPKHYDQSQVNWKSLIVSGKRSPGLMSRIFFYIKWMAMYAVVKLGFGRWGNPQILFRCNRENWII